ncbi:hypothetical protein ACFY0A_37805 [Streptomyces sp. NPDC001698]|uniref:hypothetical protein n=1 Tax=Streptomyces sp. NPDC001698 TaxID=3364601 RepID=UPI0036BA70C7
MTTALHLVPDPDDEHPTSSDTAGEQQPDPARKTAPLPDDQAPEEGPGDITERGEEDPEDEEPGRIRAFAWPDLRPYVDLMWVAHVINAGMRAARRHRQRAPQRKAERRARKAAQQKTDKEVNKEKRNLLLAIAVDVAAGTRGLLGHLRAWIGGEYAPKSWKTSGRIGLTLMGAFFAYRTVTDWPVYGTGTLIAVWGGAALGERHRQRAEQGEKKPTGKAAKQEAKPREKAPVESAETAPAEAVAEAPEQAPEPPSLEVVTRALHALVGEGRGVLLTTLRQHLGLADTRAVRGVLDGAGIRVRPGVRTAAGNGPGVHRQDFPPCLSASGPAQESPLLQVNGANANANNTERGAREGLRVDGSYWPEGKPYHFEPHPMNPDHTVIVYHQDAEKEST